MTAIPNAAFAALIADYRRRGWALVAIPAGAKGPTAQAWQTREWRLVDFPPGCNFGLILGPRSGETVDIDLDCIAALELADLYLPATGAEFGRASKPRSHRLYIAPGAVFEAFADPLLDGKNTILELRARGATGGSHQTLLPPSAADGERREWCGDTIAPAVYDAAKLRRRCVYLAMACLLDRYVSPAAARRPGPDFANLLWEADQVLGRTAYRWLGEAAPDEHRHGLQPRPRRELSRDDLDLAELVHAIPNDGCDWTEWNRIGLAIFAASGGSDHGGVIFDDWSAKSAKYNPYGTSARWRHYHRSPPDRIGVGTLVHLAKLAGWTPTRAA